jgi:hypothetical protein
MYNILEQLALKLETRLVQIKQTLSEGNFKIVKARVRNGKVQRKKKVSTKVGYTMRDGVLVRMSSSERLKRKMGARKGKSKRKAKLARSLIKRKRSMRKRTTLGV